MAAGSIDSATHVQDAMNYMDSITSSLESHKQIDSSDAENLEECLLKLIEKETFEELCRKAIALLHAILKKTSDLFEAEEKNQEVRKQVIELQKDLKQIKADLQEKQEQLDMKQEQLEMMTVCQVAFSIEEMVIEQVLPMNKGLQFKTKKPQGKVYVAGAVMEMKTCTHGRLMPSNEAQTLYEMLKLGTDMAVEDKLKKGEDVDKVIVYGILVDMQLVGALVMKLVMDFTTKMGTCYKNSKGTIDLDKAFQQIRERLVND